VGKKRTGRLGKETTDQAETRKLAQEEDVKDYPITAKGKQKSMGPEEGSPATFKQQFESQSEKMVGEEKGQNAGNGETSTLRGFTGAELLRYEAGHRGQEQQ